MKSSAPIIVLVVALGLILVGILIYVFVVLPMQKQQTTPSGNDAGGNNNAAGGGGGTIIENTEITNLVTQFRYSFQTAILTDRCASITQANSLPISDLRRFEAAYQAKYGLTVKAEMDAAWRWCGIDTVWTGTDPGQELYDKLS